MCFSLIPPPFPSLFIKLWELCAPGVTAGIPFAQTPLYYLEQVSHPVFCAILLLLQAENKQDLSPSFLPSELT